MWLLFPDRRDSETCIKKGQGTWHDKLTFIYRCPLYTVQMLYSLYRYDCISHKIKKDIPRDYRIPTDNIYYVVLFIKNKNPVLKISESSSGEAKQWNEQLIKNERRIIMKMLKH